MIPDDRDGTVCAFGECIALLPRTLREIAPTPAVPMHSNSAVLDSARSAVAGSPIAMAVSTLTFSPAAWIAAAASRNTVSAYSMPSGTSFNAESTVESGLTTQIRRSGTSRATASSTAHSAAWTAAREPSTPTTTVAPGSGSISVFVEFSFDGLAAVSRSCGELLDDRGHPSMHVWGAAMRGSERDQDACHRIRRSSNSRGIEDDVAFSRICRSVVRRTWPTKGLTRVQ